MKRIIATTVLFLSTGLLVWTTPTRAATAAAGSWSGWITDEKCAGDNDPKHSPTDPNHANCISKCLRDHARLVLYNTGDRKIYKIDKQELAKEHLGHAVVVTGKVDGDTIAVRSIVKKTPG